MKWFRSRDFYDGEWSYRLQSNVLLDAHISPSKGAKGGRWLLTVILDIPQLSIYRHYRTTYHDTVRDAMADCRRIVDGIRQEIQKVLEKIYAEPEQEIVAWLCSKGKWTALEELDGQSDIT